MEEVQEYSISQLTEAVEATDDDFVEVVIDTDTTPKSRKMKRSTLLGAVPNWRDAYSSETAYSPRDTVSYQGSSYICIQESTGNAPTDTEYWSLLASKGDTGATGATGPTGATGAQGPQGEKGDTGDTGPQGEAGPAGTPGETGATGAQGPQGEPGADGEDGSDGDSAYEVAVAHGFIGDEEAWLASLVGTQGETGATGSTGATGETGPQGDAGPGVPEGGSEGQLLAKSSPTDFETEWVDPPEGAGSSINWLGAYDNGTAYEEDDAVSYNGSSYICTAASTGNLPTDTDFWDVLAAKGDTGATGATGETGATGATGSQGPKGDPGSDGEDGDSAYEIAVTNGFVGDEEAWLASLVGAQGETGATGATGPTGDTGPQGDSGPRIVGIQVSGADVLETGDGQAFFRVPSVMNGYNLTDVAAHVEDASSSGAVTIQIHNASSTQDMLSTPITIDASENDSSDATPAVIDTDEDDVATGDWIRIDIDGAGTDVSWLFVELQFQEP